MKLDLFQDTRRRIRSPKLGRKVIRRRSLDYTFVNAAAETYYNALSTANGGDIDAATLYGISLNTLKEAIDQYFTDTNGIRSKMVHEFPMIGGTAATHAICSVDSASELTFTGSPTQDATGLVLNGTTQYADMNNDPKTELPQFSSHLCIFGDIVGDTLSIGSRDNTSDSQFVRNTSSSGQANFNQMSATTASAMNADLVMVGSRTADNDLRLYSDGTEQALDITTTSRFLPTTYSTLIGAWDNIGTPAGYTQGSIKFASIGEGLSGAEVSTLTTAIKDLNTTLGR